FTLVFKSDSRQIVAAQTQVRAGVQGIRAAIIDAQKREIAKWIERRELRIDSISVVVAPARAEMLIRNRIRELVVDLLRELHRTDQHAIAPALIGIVEVWLESNSGNRLRIQTTRERRRQRERIVVQARIRNCAVEVRADRDRRSGIKTPTRGANRIAVFVVAIHAFAHVDARQTKANPAASAQTGGTFQSFTKQRQAAAIKSKFEMRIARACLSHQIDNAANRIRPID